MSARCPTCGQKIRRQAGRGTEVDLVSPLSDEEKRFMELLQQAPREWRTVRQTRELFASKDYLKDYHRVQATLSTLTGRALVQMYRFPGSAEWSYMTR